jgi:phosphate transport system permease protein
VLGLWGILVLGPFVGKDLEPWLHRHLGFIPLFGGSPQNAGMLVAILVLTIMIVPITSSICRELFLRCAHGARAGGARRSAPPAGRWCAASSSRTRSTGVSAAILLGLGRAVGEAIAVSLVLGAGHGIHWSLFVTGDTLASKLAEEYQGLRLQAAGQPRSSTSRRSCS